MSEEVYGNEVERVVWKTGAHSRVIALGGQQDAIADQGVAIAFGEKRNAFVKSSAGCAVAFGGGEAKALTAVTMLGSGGSAIADRTAVALNHEGTAIGNEIAFADNLASQSHSPKLAINVGPRGLADGLISISLGKEGSVVARESGTIVLAFFAQHPGRWETAHGCDPYWLEGDSYLHELKVAKVGEDGIRPNCVYQLDVAGNFVEVGPAESFNT